MRKRKARNVVERRKIELGIENKVTSTNYQDPASRETQLALVYDGNDDAVSNKAVYYDKGSLMKHG